MKNKITVIFLMFLGLIFTFGGLQPADAREETGKDEFTLDEIVVTAQKRKQELHEVPLAITVVNDEQLERQKVYTLQDLARTTPALEFGDLGNSPGGAAVLRGIGTATFDNQLEPSVGVVMDGVSMGGTNVGNLFDVERVEVLRGPQGTLFGNAASAGIINIVTASPEIGIFKGRVGFDATADDVLGSKFGRQEIRVMMNIPLTEDSALRTTVNGNYMQGLRKNHYPGTLDQKDRNIDFRAKYLYMPTDDFSLELRSEYSRRSLVGPNLSAIRSVPLIGVDANQQAYFDFLRGLGCGVYDIDQAVCTSFNGMTRETRFGFTAEVDWTMWNHSFISISNYKRDIGGARRYEVGGEWFPGLFTIQRLGGKHHTNTYSQEFRMHAPEESKIDYLAGLYFNQVDRIPEEHELELTRFPFMPAFVAMAQVPTRAQYATTFMIRNTSVFADVEYPLTNALALVAGARYSLYDIELDRFDSADGTTDHTVTDESYFTWRGGLKYNFNEDIMIYSTVSRSIKSPIISPPPSVRPDDPWTIVSGEIPTNYELGSKINTLDNRLAIDFNVFLTKIADYQNQACHLENGLLVCLLGNLPEVKSEGFEIDILGRPLPGLTLNMGYIYLIGEYPPGNPLEGQQRVGLAKNKVTFSAEYGRSLTGKLYGFAAFDTVWKSMIRMNTEIGDPTEFYDDHFISGGRIGVKDMEEKWNCSLFIRNIFDEHFPVSLFPGSGTANVIPAETTFRQVGISFDYNF